MLVLAAIAFFATRKPAAEKAEVTRDVPHLEGNLIVFSPAFRERAQIEFKAIERKPFRPTVGVVGTVAFNPSYVAAIGTRLRGFVRRTLKYEGDRVEEGDALAEVESAELGEAQSSIAQEQARLDAAKRNVARERDLLAKQLTTAREAEMAETELATAEASLQAAVQRTKAFGGKTGGYGVFVLRSPLKGHVVERNIAPGQSVDGDLIGYKVADLNHLWIELSVFERDLGSVHVGDAVEVRPVAVNAKIPGTVAHVGEIIDPTTRSTAVRVAVDDPPHHLRPGQSVHATITSGAPSRDALLIPEEAVVYVDGKATVFVAEGENRVPRRRPPRRDRRLAPRGGRRSDLKAGQRIATGGVFALKLELFR